MKYLLLFTMIFAFNLSFGQSVRQQIDAVFTKNAHQEKTANALLVVHKGEVIYENVVGLSNHEKEVVASATTNFRMASITKQFTAAAIAILQKQNKLQFQQPLSDFFPNFSEVGKKITIHHLLTHTSGIVDYEEFMPQNLTEQLSDNDVLEIVQPINKTYFSVGSQFRYSNTAYCLLALIIEKVSGKSYDNFLEEEIFRPLKMTTSVVYGKEKQIENRAMGYAKNETGEIVFSDQSLTSATKGDGGVYTSLADYQSWLKNRKSTIGIDNLKLFKVSNASINENSFYSFGWFIHRQIGSPDVWFHSGSTCGFSNIVIEVPDTQTFIVYFSNLANHHQFFKPIETVLVQGKIIPSHFSFWALHQKTN